MAFDGAFLYCIKKELEQGVGSHIDKIHQPSREELVLVLRKKGFVKRLLLSAKGGMARIQFTDEAIENPDKPPMFCALCRKHFSAAYFSGMELFGFERVISLNFSSTNEMGDRVDLKIVCELITGSANVILLDSDGRIFDALHRTDLEASRLIAPGALYEYPKKRDRLDLLNSDIKDIVRTAHEIGGVSSMALLNTVDGLSPLVCREVEFRAYGRETDITSADTLPLEKEIISLRNAILSGGTPTMLLEADGKPKEFTFIDITQYGDYYKKTVYGDYSSLLDAFYKERERISRISKAGGDVGKFLKNLISRVSRRKAVREKELSACCDRESLRISGELLKANLHAVSPGSLFVEVMNFYDPELKPVRIKLDPAISASQNAARYFKEYKKSYSAEESLKKLIQSDTEEIEYLISVEDGLTKAQTLSDINEIRDELVNAGYVRQTVKKGIRKKPALNLLTFWHNGFKIVVGKNNIQNDFITTTLAKKGDIWLHTKDIHGSHTVIFTENKPVPDDTLLFAAKLAANYSKAATSSNIPVDYADVRYVKKPSGARAGMVIYTNNKTLFVTPGE